MSWASDLNLPPDVTARIDEMACTRRSDGQESTEFAIRIATSELASRCIDRVTGWVLRRLAKLKVSPQARRHPRSEELAWHTVRGVEAPRRIVVALHLGWPGGKRHRSRDAAMDDTDLVVVDENPYAAMRLRASDVLAALSRELQCIVGIGVSAVSDEYMADLWWAIVSPLGGMQGKGFLLHPMFRRFAVESDLDSTWSILAERSFDFGWSRCEDTRVGR